MRSAIQNQMNDNSHIHLFTWKERKYHGNDTQVEYLVETPKGTVSRVMLIDDKPLSPAQQREEQERIRKMLDPAQMRRKLKDQQEDDERTRKMLSTIPDAFDFTYLGSTSAPNGQSSNESNLFPGPASIPLAANPWSSPECRAKCWWTKPLAAWQKSTARSSRR